MPNETQPDWSQLTASEGPEQGRIPVPAAAAGTFPPSRVEDATPGLVSNWYDVRGRGEPTEPVGEAFKKRLPVVGGKYIFGNGHWCVLQDDIYHTCSGEVLENTKGTVYVKTDFGINGWLCDCDLCRVCFYPYDKLPGYSQEDMTYRHGAEQASLGLLKELNFGHLGVTLKTYGGSIRNMMQRKSDSKKKVPKTADSTLEALRASVAQIAATQNVAVQLDTMPSVWRETYQVVIEPPMIRPAPSPVLPADVVDLSDAAVFEYRGEEDF